MKEKRKKNPCTVAISPAQVRFRPEYPSSNRSIDSNFSSHFFKVDLLSLTCLSLGFFTVVSEIFFGLKKHYPESSTIVLSFCAVLFGVTQFLVLKTDSDLRALSDLQQFYLSNSSRIPDSLQRNLLLIEIPLILNVLDSGICNTILLLILITEEVSQFSFILFLSFFF